MDDGQTIILRPVGDVELWYAEAADCNWRLPVHVEWKLDETTGATYGLVVPGVCFYQIQALAVAAILQPYSLEDRSDRWLVARDKIEMLLKKAPGIHAEFYYLWPGETHPLIPSRHGMTVTKLRKQPVKFDSFVEFISGERGIPADVISTVLTAVSQLGARWLVEHRAPIDLGFVKLIALPFRSNWKEIVMYKGKPKDLLEALLLPTRQRAIRLASMRLPALLCSPDNIALCGGVMPMARMGYSIESIPSHVFESEVESIESARMTRGPHAYVKSYAKQIESRYEEIIECLARYAKKTVAAWAAVRKSSDGSGLAFHPQRARSVRGVPLSDLPVDIAPVGNDFSILAEREGTSQRIHLPAEAHAMQEMPAVPSPSPDMRQRSGDNGHVDKP